VLYRFLLVFVSAMCIKVATVTKWQKAKKTSQINSFTTKTYG